MIYREEDFVKVLVNENWNSFFRELNAKYNDVFVISSYIIFHKKQKINDVLVSNVKNFEKIEIYRVFENHKLKFVIHCDVKTINAEFIKNYLRLEIDQYISNLLHKHLEFHVYKDDLTEVRNYRCLFRDVEKQIEICTESGKKFTLVFVDIDNFKMINDTYGHIVGSSLLKQLSTKLIKHNDNTFKIYRYGGDEFVFLCEESSIEESQALIDPVLRKIAQEKFTIKDGLERNLELSVGFAEFPTDGKTFSEIIDIADQMMYQAKKQGKYQTNIKIKKFQKVS
ncbi:MAG: GGDEF domain-containing protein [Halobacteriovoraceae bacterium]|nr:GGDEF domain-containing protein [Halobacteriovoraceae bacterium]MCB9095578.1 GGDEF domain-containing protein [Halobacteriovoraceae bacterium]